MLLCEEGEEKLLSINQMGIYLFFNTDSSSTSSSSSSTNRIRFSSVDILPGPSRKLAAGEDEEVCETGKQNLTWLNLKVYAGTACLTDGCE